MLHGQALLHAKDFTKVLDEALLDPAIVADAAFVTPRLTSFLMPTSSTCQREETGCPTNIASNRPITRSRSSLLLPILVQPKRVKQGQVTGAGLVSIVFSIPSS